MNLKFQQLAERILREGIGDPDSAASVAREHNKSLRGGSSMEASDVESSEEVKREGHRDERGTPTFARWVVTDPKTKKTYTFRDKPGASKKAHDLADKLGVEAKWRSKHD